MRTADLLRFVDGEGNAAFRERVTAHLDGCAECTAAAERLQTAARRVLDRLNVLDETSAADKLPATFAELVQRGSHSRAAARVVGWRRAAAIILFLGVGAAVARPAAAWLERLLNPGQAPAPEVVPAVPPASEAPAAAPVDTLTAAYTFTPASKELRIDFAAAEAEAELVVRAHDEAVAALELQSTGALPPVLILPDGVRITNGTNRGTRYELVVPRNVEVLVVTVAGVTAPGLQLSAQARWRMRVETIETRDGETFRQRPMAEPRHP